MRVKAFLVYAILITLLVIASSQEIAHDQQTTIHSETDLPPQQIQPIDDPTDASDQIQNENHDEQIDDQSNEEQQQAHEEQKEQEQEQHEEEGNGGHHYLHYTEGKFWINVLIAAFLTCVGGFCSGMGVGLMNIEKIQLEIMSMGDNEEEKKVAKKILSVVSDHHLFLVTLLVANAMALETLPLIIHSLMPDWAAILFSTVIVLIGGQIVPQAFCTGPKKITIAYYASPIILCMIKVLWIIVYPMARGLDWLLGKHDHQRIQHKDLANFLGNSQNLKDTQKLLLGSILELRTERVPNIMVSVDDLYMLSSEERLTASKISEINKKDYSYLLIYKESNRDKIIGVVKTKEFAMQILKKTLEDQRQDKHETYRVKDFFTNDHEVLSVYQDTNLLEMLMLFQAKSCRFALVIGKKRKIFPGVLSIMYSKSDMIAATQEGRIQGIVFLYRIFQQIAQYEEQASHPGKPADHHKPIQLKELNHDLKQPLLSSK